MESLIAHTARKERHRLRVVSIDADANAELAEQFRVETVPAIVLIQGRRPVGRLDGRSTGGEIDELIHSALQGG